MHEVAHQEHGESDSEDGRHSTRCGFVSPEQVSPPHALPVLPERGTANRAGYGSRPKVGMAPDAPSLPPPEFRSQYPAQRTRPTTHTTTTASLSRTSH
jgi:hypothetical protein